MVSQRTRRRHKAAACSQEKPASQSSDSSRLSGPGKRSRETSNGQLMLPSSPEERNRKRPRSNTDNSTLVRLYAVLMN